MSQEEAESKLKSCDGSRFLTRYNDELKVHVLSVKVPWKAEEPAIEHFPIRMSNEGGHNQYEIDGSKRKFDDVIELLDYYKTTPLNHIVPSIGEYVEFENTYIKSATPDDTLPTLKSIPTNSATEVKHHQVR